MIKANAKKVKPVLHHCLFTAFLANQLANKIGIDPDEAFVCGLLHDMGKTILIHYLTTSSDLHKSFYTDVIAKNHCRAGYFLAAEWQLSDIVQETILYHHAPDQATKYPHHVLLTFFANHIANGALSKEDLQRLNDDLGIETEIIQPLIENFDSLKEKIAALL